MSLQKCRFLHDFISSYEIETADDLHEALKDLFKKLRLCVRACFLIICVCVFEPFCRSACRHNEFKRGGFAHTFGAAIYGEERGDKASTAGLIGETAKASSHDSAGRRGRRG